jgi:hypothetical protein
MGVRTLTSEVLLNPFLFKKDLLLNLMNIIGSMTSEVKYAIHDDFIEFIHESNVSYQGGSTNEAYHRIIPLTEDGVGRDEMIDEVVLTPLGFSEMFYGPTIISPVRAVQDLEGVTVGGCNPVFELMKMRLQYLDKIIITDDALVDTDGDGTAETARVDNLQVYFKQADVLGGPDGTLTVDDGVLYNVEVTVATPANYDMMIGCLIAIIESLPDQGDLSFWANEREYYLTDTYDLPQVVGFNKTKEVVDPISVWAYVAAGSGVALTIMAGAKKEEVTPQTTAPSTVNVITE